MSNPYIKIPKKNQLLQKLIKKTLLVGWGKRGFHRGAKTFFNEVNQHKKTKLICDKIQSLSICLFVTPPIWLNGLSDYNELYLVGLINLYQPTIITFNNLLVASNIL